MKDFLLFLKKEIKEDFSMLMKKDCLPFLRYLGFGLLFFSSMFLFSRLTFKIVDYIEILTFFKFLIFMSLMAINFAIHFYISVKLLHYYRKKD